MRIYVLKRSTLHATKSKESKDDYYSTIVCVLMSGP